VSGELPPRGLDHFQAEIAEVALRAIGQHGFALAGAGALVAHGVISRPTQDLDLFTPAEGGPARVSAALLTALTDAGCQVQVLESAEQHGGEFMRLQVHRGEHVVDIDLARDWRQHPSVRMQVGPVLHVEDAVASKVTAMIGRGRAGSALRLASRHPGAHRPSQPAVAPSYGDCRVRRRAGTGWTSTPRWPRPEDRGQRDPVLRWRQRHPPGPPGGGRARDGVRLTDDPARTGGVRRDRDLPDVFAGAEHVPSLVELG